MRLFFATSLGCDAGQAVPAKPYPLQAPGYTSAMQYKLTIQVLILAIAGGAFTLPALAQWQWIDKDGRKVFSDRAPPADVLQKNILRQPGSKPAGAAVPNIFQETMASPVLRASAPVQKPAAPKPSGKDAELETRKKQSAESENAHKQAEAEKIAVAKADNCDRAKKGQANLLSGVRISVVNNRGEREIMDDNARLSETLRLQAIADSDCVK